MSAKKNAKKSSEQSELLTTQRLCEIWEKVLSDIDARGAFERLGKAGFPISHLKPNDATFKRPSWPDYICALPLLPNKPSTRHIHDPTSPQKYLALVQELRELAGAEGAFREVVIFARRDYSAVGTLREDLLKTASMIENYSYWHYCIRHINPRHALIAELRWTIRHRTGKPHDRELNILLDASFRAAGYKDGFYMDPNALDRIEKRQSESRAKVMRRIRERMEAAAACMRSSTRIRRDSRKRV
jgi:hypothetical protein